MTDDPGRPVDHAGGADATPDAETDTISLHQ